MATRAKIGPDRFYELGLQAEREGLDPSVIGNPARLVRLRLLRSLEQLVQSITGSADVDVDIAVTSKHGGKARQIELRITGPYSATLLRAIRQDMKGLKRAKSS